MAVPRLQTGPRPRVVQKRRRGGLHGVPGPRLLEHPSEITNHRILFEGYKFGHTEKIRSRRKVTSKDIHLWAHEKAPFFPDKRTIPKFPFGKTKTSGNACSLQENDQSAAMSSCGGCSCCARKARPPKLKELGYRIPGGLTGLLKRIFFCPLGCIEGQK